MNSSSFKNNVLLSVFAFVFSLGILSKAHWPYAILFSLSIFASYQWLYERKNHWIYLVLAGLIGIGYGVLLHPLSWSFGVYIALGLLVLTYEKGIKWRKIPFLKPIFISICWFTLGIGIPKVALYGHIPNQDFSHILLFLVLAIVEDLEDRAVDEGHIKTIPLYLKKSETDALISLWLFTYLALSSKIDLFSGRIDIKMLSVVLTMAPLVYFIYLKKSPKINHRYFDFILFLIGLLHLLV
ncbi:MAG: hypothetical protein RLZZ585_1687 [Bacteroidota bacterium]|jgi:hypothetical protein